MLVDWKGVMSAALIALLAPMEAAGQGRTGSLTEAQQTLQEADAEQKRGNAAEATKLYRKAIQLDPRLTQAYERFSMSLFAKKKFVEGERVIRRGLQQLPDNPSLTAQLGMHLYKQGKTQEAHKYLKPAVSALPDRFEIQATASQCCLAVEDYKCAIAGLRNFLKSRPSSIAARDHLIRTMLGTALLRDGRPKAAKVELERVLRGHPKNIQARLAMAEVYLEEGDCSRAVAAFESIRAKAQKTKDYHLKLGRAYYCTRRYRRAASEANSHLATEPRSIDALVLRGDAQVEIRNYAGALKDYRQAASLGNADDLRIKIATVHFRRRKYRSALGELQPLLSGGTAKTPVMILAVRAAIMSRQKKEALQLASQMLTRPNPGADVYYYAGMANASLGKFEPALELYAKALQAEPKHPGARHESVKALCFLSRAARRDKDNKKALALMRRARKISPRSLVVNRNLALIYIDLGKHDLALRRLAPVLKKTPNDFVANRMAGRARLALGQHKRALKHFTRAVASVMRHGGVVLARALAESGVTRMWLGQTKQALVELERARELAQNRPETAAFLVQVKRNIARAHMLRAKEAMEAGKQKMAYAEVQRALGAGDSLPAEERTTVEAAAAVCALTLGQAAQAQELLGKLKGQVNQVLAAPYDKLGAKFLDTYADYLAPNPRAKQNAANRLAKMANKLRGKAKQRVLDLARSAQEQAAVLYYRTGKKALAKRALARASAMSKRGLSAEQRHNMAVLAYVSGQRNNAVGALETVKGRVPLALCNLAVHYERTGSMQQAFKLFQECKRRGGAYPGLDDIVQAKRRIFGEVVQ